MLRSTVRPGVLAAFSLTLLGAGCADDPRGFDALDGRRRLSDLSLVESQLVCDWVDEQALAEARGSGHTSLRCGRATRPFSYHDYAESCPDPRETQCPTTLVELRRCIPVLFEELERAPCRAAQLSTLDELDLLVKELPACRNVARCAYHPPVDDLAEPDDGVVVLVR